MGSVQAERAEMASGINTTSRFCGILIGFAGLGSVLANGVRSVLLQGLPRLGLRTEPATVERLVAGDLTHAVATVGGLPPAGLEGSVRTGFSSRFANAFLVAAAAAAAIGAGVVVHGCMRNPGAAH